MEGNAVFGVSPAPPQGISGIYVQGAAGAAGIFTVSPGSVVSIPSGGASFPAAVTVNTAFASSLTQFINPLNIAWSISQSGTSCTNGACATAGISSNPVYVTLAQSVLPSTKTTMLTYVSLAVGSGGATSQSSALAGTWAQFSNQGGPANVKTWDGRAMSYYTVGFQACALDATGIVETTSGAPLTAAAASGQCGSFAWLLESALAMNGIHSQWTRVQASDGSLLVVKQWQLQTPSYSSAAPWQYNFLLNSCITCNGADFMVPVSSSGYGDLQNGSGVAGQNSPTPLEKAFVFHFIVYIPTASGNQYYDPSYGVTYPSAAGFETQALSGYANQILGDRNGNYHFRVAVAPPLSVNVTFTTVNQNSM